MPGSIPELSTSQKITPHLFVDFRCISEIQRCHRVCGYVGTCSTPGAQRAKYTDILKSTENQTHSIRRFFFWAVGLRIRLQSTDLNEGTAGGLAADFVISAHLGLDGGGDADGDTDADSVDGGRDAGVVEDVGVDLGTGVGVAVAVGTAMDVGAGVGAGVGVNRTRRLLQSWVLGASFHGVIPLNPARLWALGKLCTLHKREPAGGTESNGGAYVILCLQAHSLAGPLHVHLRGSPNPRPPSRMRQSIVGKGRGQLGE